MAGFLTTVFAAAEVTAEPLRRLRLTDPALGTLVAVGRERSATFRHLIDRLEASEWLVFVQPGGCVDRVVIGCLLHMVGRFEGRSYLRMMVRTEGRHPDQVIGTVAHELQHALEVVFDGGATDGPSLHALIERTSDSRFKTSKATVFETKAARRVEDRVLRELRDR